MKTMPDKYINASRLIRRLEYVRKSELAELVGNPIYAGTTAEVRMYQIYDNMIGLLKNEPGEDVVPAKPLGWPVCQQCGRPMVDCGEKKVGADRWKQYSCKDCYNQNVARKVANNDA